MPFVHIHIAQGRAPETRRRLVEAITEAVTEILETERGATQVLIHEHDKDNWAIGGELLSERRTARSGDALPDLDSLFKKLPEKPSPKAPVKAAAKTASAKSRSRR